MKRQLDEFDLQASNEGNAIRNVRSLQPRSKVGKRIQKMNSGEKRGYTIQENKVVKKYFK